ncbi:MAG: GGDEF domain-containing protein [Candidatus Eremiobacteraeota bacterium]|nr:GGDEF domain-containing protein [Candidatus Eremiobacteraeota bacterium]
MIAALVVAFLAYEYARFRHVAERDDLTGLNNRRHFERALLSNIRNAERSGTPFALFYMDLDGFKEVNDTYGHRVGDELLRAFARRLQDNVDHSDIVARLGGDEFGLIVTAASEAQASSIAKRLTSLLSQPYALRRNVLEIGCSMGFSVHPTDGVSPSELVQAADQAMYRVKRAKVGVVG